MWWTRGGFSDASHEQPAHPGFVVCKTGSTVPLLSERAGRLIGVFHRHSVDEVSNHSIHSTDHQALNSHENRYKNRDLYQKRR